MGAVRTFPGRTPILTSVLLPDGARFYVKDIVSVWVDTGAPTIVNIGLAGDTAAHAYTAADASAADNIRKQVESAVSGATTGSIEITDTSLSLIYSGVVPNLIGFPSAFNGYLIGTGFLASGINAAKGDDGSGNVFVFSVVTIMDDSNIFMTYGPIAPASVYTVYVSTDGGTNWTTTGLTITAF